MNDAINSALGGDFPKENEPKIGDQITEANAGELEAGEGGPYTCCQCNAATWNDDDWCDDCRRPAPSAVATPSAAVGGEGAGSPSEAEPKARFRHKKRGTFYTLVGGARLQCANPMPDMSEVVVYEGDDGDLWVRPNTEFWDGRFECVSVAALQPSSAADAKPVDARAICEALGFDPTNHHNAAACPYCIPDEALRAEIKARHAQPQPSQQAGTEGERLDRDVEDALERVLGWFSVWVSNDCTVGWVDRNPLEPPAAYLEQVKLQEMGPGDGQVMLTDLDIIGRNADAILAALKTVEAG